MQSTNSFQKLHEYFSTSLYQEESFTNENIQHFLENSKKVPPLDPARNKTQCVKFPLSYSINLLNTLDPQNEVIISMDGSSFPEKHRAGCCARVFPPGKKYSYENPIFIGDRDSLYAELYSFISALEILYTLIEQQKIIPKTKIHFLTDSKEARYLLMSKAPPEKHSQIVLFLRQSLKKTLKMFIYEIHWIPGHVGVGIHEKTHRCARAAAQYYNKVPKFPHEFKISVFPRGEGFYGKHDFFLDQKVKLPEIYAPPLNGNAALLISKFFINYIISNPQTTTTTTIEQKWFDCFKRSNFVVPPPWTKNNLLVTALRTPYIVTHDLFSAPLNALGWAYYQDNPKLPEFGFFEPLSACNQLFLHILTEYEVKFLNKKIEQDLQANKVDPWRVAFFISEKEEKHLREFPNTISNKIATFNIGKTTIHLCLIENTIAHKLDPPMHNKLNKWLQQFPNHKIHLQTEETSVRRSIQPYFQADLPSDSTILSQSYMNYLNPQTHPPKPDVDPTINLTGFHPNFNLHISEIKNCNSLLQQIYKHHSYKYKKIKHMFNK